MRNLFVRLIIAQAIVLVSAVALAQETFQAEDHGQLPLIRSISISPVGRHYAYIQRGPDVDYFVIMNTETYEIVGGANASQVKARWADFVTNDIVILSTSTTARSVNIRG